MDETHDDTIMRVEDLAVHFPMGGGLLGGQRRWLHAVDGVDLELKRGECLGLVGDPVAESRPSLFPSSGCRHQHEAASCSTVRMSAEAPVGIGRTARDLPRWSSRTLTRRSIHARLSPDARSAAPPPRRHQQQRDRRAHCRRAETCGLAARSGGACPTSSQAASVSASARACADLRPKIIVLDEPVSALDSIRAQIINLCSS